MFVALGVNIKQGPQMCQSHFIGVETYSRLFHRRSVSAGWKPAPQLQDTMDVRVKFWLYRLLGCMLHDIDFMGHLY